MPTRNGDLPKAMDVCITTGLGTQTTVEVTNLHLQCANYNVTC